MTTEVAHVTDRYSHDFVYATKWNWVLKFVQGKGCEINSREAFHMNIFGISCTSTGASSFAEGLRHTWNNVTYTRSQIGSLILLECMSNFEQYMHVEYHSAVFPIKNTEKISWGRWLWACKCKNLGKKDRRITISEDKQYFNESFVE